MRSLRVPKRKKSRLLRDRRRECAPSTFRLQAFSQAHPPRARRDTERHEEEESQPHPYPHPHPTPRRDGKETAPLRRHQSAQLADLTKLVTELVPATNPISLPFGLARVRAHELCVAPRLPLLDTICRHRVLGTSSSGSSGTLNSTRSRSGNSGSISSSVRSISPTQAHSAPTATGEAVARRRAESSLAPRCSASAPRQPSSRACEASGIRCHQQFSRCSHDSCHRAVCILAFARVAVSKVAVSRVAVPKVAVP